MAHEKRHFQWCPDQQLFFGVHISWRKMEARRNQSLNPFWLIQIFVPEIPDFTKKETEMHLISSLTFVRKILKLFSYSIEKAFHGNQIMRVKKEKEGKKNPKQNKTRNSKSQSQALH